MNEKIKLQEAFLHKYPKTAQKICAYFEEATGQEADFENLTKPNLARFVDYLQDHLAGTSVKTYLAQLKAVMNIYSEDFDFPKGWEKMITVKDDESQSTYLTETEIQRIIDYKPDTLTKATVQQQFVLGCLTGARHSDYSKFTEKNLTQHGTLVYVSQKTHTKAELPLSPVAKSILFAKGTPFAQAYKRTVSDTTFNEVIRTICKQCGINNQIQLYRRGEFWTGEKWEAVSTHTARKSFCSNLYLRCRDLYLVSKLAGHKDVSMTERYICVGMESMTDAAMAYFEQFK